MSVSDTTLRPYYNHDTFDAGYPVIFKPGVGLINMQDGKPITTTVLNQTSVLLLGKGIGINGLGALEASNRSIVGSGDKNYAYDLELQEYFDTSNLSELLKNLVYSFVKNYCKFLFVQPLEITRLVLQVGRFDNLASDSGSGSGSRKKEASAKNDYLTSSRLLSPNGPDTSSDFDEDDTEEINYFQSTNEWNETLLTKSQPSLEPALSPVNLADSHSTIQRRRKKTRDIIQPVSKHTVDVLSALVSKDGPFALFRGINANFLYQTLNHTIEAWITGFFSPFLGIPDPFFLELTHSNDPFRSLCLSVASCVMTGLVLMPLDIIRVKLMLTQFNVSDLEKAASSNEKQQEEEEEKKTTTTQVKVNTRSIRECIRYYPTEYLLKPPAGVSILTVLHLLASSLFRKMTPYILYIKFNVDSYSSPNVYTVVNFLSLILEFFIKLPLENLLRKEQVRFLLTNKPDDKEKVLSIKEDDMIVDFNDVWKTTATNDGSLNGTSSLVAKVKRLGLFNGWRVGVLNVIGFYGYNILKSNGAELREEKL